MLEYSENKKQIPHCRNISKIQQKIVEREVGRHP